MFNITTQRTSNASGRPQVIAKGHGRQRTVSVDLSKSEDHNHGAALGTLLSVLLDDRQKAMLRHPSGGQRVRFQEVRVTNIPTVVKWSINV